MSYDGPRRYRVSDDPIEGPIVYPMATRVPSETQLMLIGARQRLAVMKALVEWESYRRFFLSNFGDAAMSRFRRWMVECDELVRKLRREADGSDEQHKEAFLMLANDIEFAMARAEIVMTREQEEAPY